MQLRPAKWKLNNLLDINTLTLFYMNIKECSKALSTNFGDLGQAKFGL